MKSYSAEFRDQILKEIAEVGNISLVSKKHGLRPSTVHSWLHKIKNKDKISTSKAIREMEKKLKDQEHEILVLRADRKN